MGPQLNEQQCRARIITWCTGCSVANWATGTGVLTAGSDVGTCIDTYFATASTWNDGNADCEDNNGGESTQTFCSAFI